MVKRGLRFLSLFGLDFQKFVQSISNVPRFLKDYNTLRAQQRKGKNIRFGRFYPVLSDFSDNAGVAKGHYFHQDLHVAQLIFASAPTRHVDIGSRIDGFVAHLAAFREVEVVDIRALASTVPNIQFIQADVTDDAVVEKIGLADSVSCLHVIEHFGLGRYGDSIDINGHLKGINIISRLVRPGGTLYLSAPIGPERIEFNAHRVFSLATLASLPGPDFVLRSVSYVDDAGEFHKSVKYNAGGMEGSFGCQFGCGILCFERISSP